MVLRGRSRSLDASGMAFVLPPFIGRWMLGVRRWVFALSPLNLSTAFVISYQLMVIRGRAWRAGASSGMEFVLPSFIRRWMLGVRRWVFALSPLTPQLLNCFCYQLMVLRWSMSRSKSKRAPFVLRRSFVIGHVFICGLRFATMRRFTLWKFAS